MQAASKKTGSVLYFEPLRVELNDCFGALKHVTPDKVFSNLEGIQNNESNDEAASSSTNDVEIQPETPTKAEKKKPKCNLHILFICVIFDKLYTQ